MTSLPLLTADEMRALDRATIESGHMSGEALMERAGRGVVDALERCFGPAAGRPVLVVCGTGNNGGDGLCAARHLRARGAAVTTVVLGERERVKGDARAHLERAEAAGVRPSFATAPDDLRPIAPRRWECVVDAVLGTGARGDPEGLAAAAVDLMGVLRLEGARVVAVDLPTGVDTDRGAAAHAVQADLTVTFGAPKRGHVLHPGRTRSGRLEIVDIGLLPIAPGAHPFELATAEAMATLLPWRDPRAHKGSVGRVLVVGGSVGLTGAVRLAARGASRTGAGYVQCCVPSSLNDPLEVALQEEMTIPCPETGQRAFALDALDPILAHARAADAVALGSGLSRHPEALELARRLVEGCARPMVIDADGLNAFEGRTDALARGGAPRVVTPHLGEAARLTGLTAAHLESRRLDAAREWAVRLGVVLVLKGAPTVTASSDGRATVNPTGNAGMATAGVGDVLTGVVAALLAQGLLPYDAARLGVYLHGLAGDRAAEQRGPIGLCAGDLVEALPGARRGLAGARQTKTPAR